MSDAVPTLDARAAAAAHFAHDLAAAYAEYGFVIIQNHGIDKQVIDQCLACFRRFFALPDAEKRRYQLPNGGGARGYTPFGIETAKGARHHDLKEFWHVGRELPPGHRYARDMAPNIWVEGIAGFRESTLSLYEAFDALGRRLLAPIARTIGLPENYFDDKVNYGNSVLRVIHYPPMPPEPTPSVRAGAHEDINVITLLLGAEEPGLEVLSKKGEWLPINPAPGSLVCNVGDMLQRLTNGRLRSTTHRVVNPPRERASKARYSLPFFLHFNPDFLIETLPQCVDAQHPDQFPVPITAHDFLQERLREIKLI
ncbi:MAG TPA: 2-oxoglutarate and iron-dependent oxygenase domain-containing protein [Steroidobacteraceae bacterium]|jgi:isopenicillin N synthase-like dioxygenase|nr:2-oxoglutarate and iron-dependent oxygenase domain-containing protein [Steroidobacteraceae bacterium]